MEELFFCFGGHHNDHILVFLNGSRFFWIFVSFGLILTMYVFDQPLCSGKISFNASEKNHDFVM